MNADLPGVVFDCNVFLQAVANDQSAAANALDFLETQKITLFVSEAVLSEVREVLARPKLRKRLPRITDVRVSALLQRLTNMAVLIQNVPEAFKYERDPKDELYLNLAIVAKATHLVSRDRDLLDLMTSATEEARRFHSLCPSLGILEVEEFVREIESRQSAGLE
jgi:uncharacterized protein